jgi:hypothetical protein
MGPVLAIGLAFGGGATTVTLGGVAVTSVSTALSAVATTAVVGGLVVATNEAMKNNNSNNHVEDYDSKYIISSSASATAMNNNNNNNNDDIHKKIKDIIDEQCVDKAYDGVKDVVPEKHKSIVDGISHIHSGVDLLRHPTGFKVAKGICEIGHHFEKHQ